MPSGLDLHLTVGLRKLDGKRIMHEDHSVATIEE
jgi:hypothetical protein